MNPEACYQLNDDTNPSENEIEREFYRLQALIRPYKLHTPFGCMGNNLMIREDYNKPAVEFDETFSLTFGVVSITIDELKIIEITPDCEITYTQCETLEECAEILLQIMNKYEGTLQRMM